MRNEDEGLDDIQLAFQQIVEAAQLAANEEQLKIGIEAELKQLCVSRGIEWSPYTYEHGFDSGRRRLDAAHGATIIEYEAPLSFHRSENAKLKHAQGQAEEYAALLSKEEGRSISAYSLIVWDGESISFANSAAGEFWWEPVEQFDCLCLARVVELIKEGGRPLVSPQILCQYVGPYTDVGRTLIPALYRSIVFAQESSVSTRTNLIFLEWARLFGQVDGESSENLISHLDHVSLLHDVDYSSNSQAYIFALNTYIAIIAKVCAVYALASGKDANVILEDDLRLFLEELENGDYFKRSGIANMLSTDFFSWYLGDDVSEDLNTPLAHLLNRLNSIDFDITRKSAESVRDLFKGLYMEFIPTAMRHALGEYYTPDWLASHVVDAVEWEPDQSFLDPTCGSGTFVLEAVKRRLEHAHPKDSAHTILEGIYGCDLNPLAVLTTRASLVVSLANRFDLAHPVVLPVFLSDAINTADAHEGIFRHVILTEKGERLFAIPEKLANSIEFFDVMDLLRLWIDSGLDRDRIIAALERESACVHELDASEMNALSTTVQSLVDLHKNHWNGIWCLILFDRISAGCIQDIDCVVGNPPWVKWSHLPRQYAEFIKPICDRMDIFSEDNWVGGIQSDVSTVVTYHALERFVRKGGRLAFLITGTVFKNESSQGFRRWELQGDEGVEAEPMTVLRVEDYRNLKPFDNVSNWPTLILIERNGEETTYPVPYLQFKGPAYKIRQRFDASSYVPMLAAPIPGTLDGPWLVGAEGDLSNWQSVFDVAGEANYTARKGVTTDANGIYFVEVDAERYDEMIRIKNDPSRGRRRVPQRTRTVEPDFVFPLLRGRDISRFCAESEAGLGVIVPQEGMFGAIDLPITNPRLYEYLSLFEKTLLDRSSYKRFQRNGPFWSIWSTGSYTFAPYKVVWKEMSGNAFAAAYVSSATVGGVRKVVVPDHKVYFIPLDNEEEAAFLMCYLNSRIVSSAIDAYSSALSLGTSIVSYLYIPQFDSADERMRELASIGVRLHNGEEATSEIEERINNAVEALIKDR